MVPFKCDVHGWMNAYVGVLDHPYFAVTDERRQVRAEDAAARAPTRSKRGTRSSARRRRASRSARRKRRTSPSRSRPPADGDELTAMDRRARRAAGRAGRAASAATHLPIQPTSPACPERCSTGSRSFVAACTVLLILAGSLVTSTDPACRCPTGRRPTAGTCSRSRRRSGSADIFYEHGHRLIASTVGFLTIILAVWLWLRGPAPLDELARRRRARRRHRAGRPRRHHGPVLPAGRRSRPRTRASPKSSSA